ncbi:hypothetical protein GCM10010495_58670 [Kitasatospora herbaricolor]|nr:hypothetical protein GCM10010495_58670 [Kitasatospora herbaricolor]
MLGIVRPRRPDLHAPPAGRAPTRWPVTAPPPAVHRVPATGFRAGGPAAVREKVPHPRDILTPHVVMRGMHGDHGTNEQAVTE